ncbi:hypothetical protein SANTM175S_05662 [Streptomyces antimycoticus]
MRGLNPISMTTAPVTTGGIAAWMIRAPNFRTARPLSSSTPPTTRIAPVTAALPPPCALIAAATPTKDRLHPR